MKATGDVASAAGGGYSDLGAVTDCAYQNYNSAPLRIGFSNSPDFPRQMDGAAVEM